MIDLLLDRAASRDRPRAYLQTVVIYLLAYVHLRLFDYPLWLVALSYAAPAVSLELALLVRRRLALRRLVPRAVARFR